MAGPHAVTDSIDRCFFAPPLLFPLICRAFLADIGR